MQMKIGKIGEKNKQHGFKKLRTVNEVIMKKATGRSALMISGSEARCSNY